MFLPDAIWEKILSNVPLVLLHTKVGAVCRNFRDVSRSATRDAQAVVAQIQRWWRVRPSLRECALDFQRLRWPVAERQVFMRHPHTVAVASRLLRRLVPSPVDVQIALMAWAEEPLTEYAHELAWQVNVLVRREIIRDRTHVLPRSRARLAAIIADNARAYWDLRDPFRIHGVLSRLAWQIGIRSMLVSGEMVPGSADLWRQNLDEIESLKRTARIMGYHVLLRDVENRYRH